MTFNFGEYKDWSTHGTWYSTRMPRWISCSIGWSILVFTSSKVINCILVTVVTNREKPCHSANCRCLLLIIWFPKEEPLDKVHTIYCNKIQLGGFFFFHLFESIYIYIAWSIVFGNRKKTGCSVHNSSLRMERKWIPRVWSIPHSFGNVPIVWYFSFN